ncbi:MAG: type III-A CRISPR-associated RAMP protein Csm5 [Candidatus Heimdallarchaeaceae archaeon]
MIATESKKVKVETLTPIFVGSGESVDFFNYVFDGKNINVISIDKLSKTSLDPVNLTNKLLSEKDISKVLRCYGLDYKDFVDFSIEVGDSLRSSFLTHHIRRISLFIRDKEGKLYLPGSSLKGALRTALLYYSKCNKCNEDKLLGEKGFARTDGKSTGVSTYGFSDMYSTNVKNVVISAKREPNKLKDLDLFESVEGVFQGSIYYPFGKFRLVRESAMEYTKRVISILGNKFDISDLSFRIDTISETEDDSFVLTVGRYTMDFSKSLPKLFDKNFVLNHLVYTRRNHRDTLLGFVKVSLE